MKKSVGMVLLLALLLMAMVSPFSALAMLMLVVFGSAFFWTLWTLLQTLITGDARERG
ncbi:MAG: hypothetical protein KME08_06385 [Aphanothece sp. CMT-3BRIN-NPC111]|jgi:hypothetical protein|nr:hypothetical protein [Aphanothece sp. CMT-3BRIN-NPC111]